MKFQAILLFILFCLINPSFAQNTEKYIYHIKKNSEKTVLDGILNENYWNSTQVAKDFFLNQPFDSTFASYQSEVRLSFDEENLYLAAVIYQPKDKYTTATLKRDFASGTSDIFSFNIDPFKDKLNGFQFGITPYNVQREALISQGEQIDNSWDNKWFSAVKNYDDKWVVEMSIPFKTLRYKLDASNENSWRINFGRFFMAANEVSTWAAVPRNFRPANLAFTGLLVWDDAPPKPGANVSLIPFVSSGLNYDYPRNPTDLNLIDKMSNPVASIGLDAKIAVTPSLNLDLTVNPDFSQVEVDQQQTNLSRFELFYPERRQFFIENSDLFGTFGFPDTRPFFSRRIGISQNPKTKEATRVPILAGARLSGKINNDLRIGLMNMQTRKVKFGSDNYLPATNYTVVTAQQKLFSRSSIGGILVNKENLLAGIPESNRNDFKAFNRVAGLEFNYFSKDNRIETETYFHKSFSPNVVSDATSFAHYMGYHHPNLDLNFGYVRIGQNYNAETGYVPRPGVNNFYRPINLIFNPKNEKVSKYINSYGFGVEGNDVYSLSWRRLDSETAFSFFVNTPNQSEVSLGYFMGYTLLLNKFDPTNADENPNPDFYKNVVPLDSGAYKYRTFFLSFNTSNKNKFIVNFDGYGGKYFNGQAAIFESSFMYRFQPYGSLNVDCNYTNISLPKPYNSVNYWLIGPKANISFSKTLFLSTFFQFNTQTNNTNINSRLQWRFKPVSDLFLVYTDNYFAQNIPNYGVSAWTPKNRALILKITYWLNV